MPQTLRILFLLLLFNAFAVSLLAQTPTDERVSIPDQTLRFPQFVQAVEARTAYRFFYNPADVDTLPVRVSAENQPVRTLLQQIFSGSTFNYAIDAQQRVYITLERVIRTELPIGFFRGGLPGVAPDTTLNDYLGQSQKKRTEPEAKTYEIGKRTSPIKPGRATISGYVRNVASGEPVVGAALYVENPRLGTVSDQFGFYSITLPRGRYELRIRTIGMKDARRRIILYTDDKFDIEMEDDVIALKEVVIEAEKDKNISSLQMGQERIDIKSIKQVPTALGEADLLRVIQTLPGVKTVGESSTGLNVRGGSTDQNLILYNDATIYNSSHLFGFFSAFNPDMIKSAELYKSAMPSRFGGRLSSVLDVQTRDGNKKTVRRLGRDWPADGAIDAGRADSERQNIVYCGRPVHLFRLAAAAVAEHIVPEKPGAVLRP